MTIKAYPTSLRFLRTSALTVALAAISTFSLQAAGRTCRVLLLGGQEDSPGKIMLFDGKTAQEIELPGMNLSPVYTIAAGDISLRLLESMPEKPEDIPSGAPGAKVGETVSDIYLLVTPDPKNKITPLSMQVIDVNPAGFKKGQSIWFNLTANRVGGKLGSKKLALEPNSRNVTESPADANEDYHVNLFYQAPGEKDVWPLCQTMWRHDPTSRTLMFVLQAETGAAPRLMSFPDFRMEEKAKE